MPLDGKNYLDGKPHFIYTFVDATNGENINIDSELLRVWCTEHRVDLVRQLVPIDKRIAISFLKENVIDLEHVGEVARLPKLDPVIWGLSGTVTEGRPDVLLIDGHHRYFLAWTMGMPYLPSYILTPEQWREFQIIGLPQQTREQLVAAPTKHQFERLFKGPANGT